LAIPERPKIKIGPDLVRHVHHVLLANRRHTGGIAGAEVQRRGEMQVVGRRVEVRIGEDRFRATFQDGPDLRDRTPVRGRNPIEITGPHPVVREEESTTLLSEEFEVAPSAVIRHIYDVVPGVHCGLI